MNERLTAVLDRFVGACAGDPRIVAGFLGGSHARGEADEHSDLDLCVIATDDAYEAVRSERAAFVQKLGRPLFLEDFGGDVLFVILDDGTELELSVGRSGGLDELEAGPHRVLFDREGLLDGVTFAQGSTDPDARIAVLRRSFSWFWHELGHFITAAGRDQLWWAAGQLEALRGHAVNLARIEQGADIDDEPYWKLDTTVTQEALEPLRATFVPIERTALVGAARSVVEDVDRRGRKLAADLGVAYPDDLAALMIRRLAAL